MKGERSGEPRGKVTYTTAGVTEDFHGRFEQAVGAVKGALGNHHPMYIGAEERTSQAGEFSDTSPADTRIVLGYFQKGTREDARAAIEEAQEAFPSWRTTPYLERIDLLRNAADLLDQRKFALAALMSLEVGKNRLESMGDVEESIDLIRYYCDQMAETAGFDRPMGRLAPNERTRSVLRPYGAWVVISPFNFPLALAAGPSAGALLAGNTVVFKPASDAPFTGLQLDKALTDAGLPRGVFNTVTGSGGEIGAELVGNPAVAGLTITGSYGVGFEIFRRFSRVYPRPCIAEMGGKNPAIVTRHADLETAAEGVMRSAFGYGGQKCSACSRVYVEASVKDQFLKLLVEKTNKILIGDPLKRETYLGPLIHQTAYRDYQRCVEEASRAGEILTGGQVLADELHIHGYYVTPMIVDKLPRAHRFFHDELFLPILVIASVGTFEQAVELANEPVYGLTAGLFSEDLEEIETFLREVQAGVLYVNRRSGATTGAWPGIQPFCGWKGSGSTGKGACGPYYVQQYMREQSHTLVEWPQG